MPTADRSSGNREAISTFRRLVAASVPMVMTRSRPAAAARATTSATSEVKRSSSRCAWVSITGMTGGLRPRGLSALRAAVARLALVLHLPLAHLLVVDRSRKDEHEHNDDQEYRHEAADNPGRGRAS